MKVLPERYRRFQRIHTANNDSNQLEANETVYLNNKSQPDSSASLRQAISWATFIRSCQLGLLGVCMLLACGCTPTVKVATDEPITINLNVNIKHEILVKAEEDLEDLFSNDSELF